ncbi:MAG: family 20 glycosylhydrolase [Chitinophagaceae bacterium]|nr:family 20 glycosylhydrolase [Chitinophagaceae bacterium]
MRHFTRLTRLLVVYCLSGTLPAAGQVDHTGGLMPVPKEYNPTDARFPITDNFKVAVTGPCDPRLYAEASRFIRRLSERTGIFLDKQGFVGPKDNDPTSSLLIEVHAPGKLSIDADESYNLDISSTRVRLSAATDIGAIRGLETLLQMLSAGNTGYYFPGATIRDTPRFPWRGLLLDVALHFMPVDEVKRTLDGMAAVKMNVLHLHLCNDQGFRVESKVFPRLHKVASDGMYYTQEDIRSIIQYAGERGIRIVPEFVVPAHTTAILTAYPELASIQRNYTLQRYFGVFDPIMDPTNEKVYVFLDKLFTEMTALFPDAYFHIGGDENTGKDWQASPRIRTFMKTHNMKTFMDLQTYFNRRIQPILRKNGKIMMGWDEIWQPGVPKDIVIQSWHGNTPFFSSVRAGYKAILSSGYYIDLIQPASYHYLNDPIPDSIRLTNEEAKNILGGEATMWSELVSPETVDSRIWPRTAAIAERLWSPASVADTNDMYRRLNIVSLQLEYLGLRHQLYQQALLRRLTNSYDTRALQTLVDVLEPLKIYQRNQGDTMYTVFSPLTKLADAAIPDPPLPRLFNIQIDDFLQHPTPQLEKAIREKLTLWKDNDTAFRRLLAHSPVLQEAASHSENLSVLASAGLEAIQRIHDHIHPSSEWLQECKVIADKAQTQDGRCELQVVTAIYKLILRAGQPNPNPAGPATGFWQEYHEAYPVGATPNENEVRSIAVDPQSNIWIATAAGVFLKKQGDSKWSPCPTAVADKGPAYAVVLHQSVIFIGSWNGLFHTTGANTMEKIPGTEGPISTLCHAAEGIYALGPRGAWLFDGKRLVKKNYSLPRSIRSAVSDGTGGIWIASDVGLYHCNGQNQEHYEGSAALLSAGLRGLATDDDHRLWAGGLGGVSILEDGKKQKEITPHEGCPSIYVNCVRRSPDGTMWVGTRVGVVRYYADGSHSLRFSRRWLMDDQVNDVAFDTAGNAWIATAQGVSAIRRKWMTLASKQDYFYDVLMKRHIRAPWIAGQCHLKIAGDTTSWQPEDDDNDGEFTGNYLTMESFRYAVTHSEDARIKAGKAFRFLMQLREVTDGDGYFARTIVPAGWGERVHDGNIRYTPQEHAEKEVEDPRYKPVENRWRLSADGKWRWKGDASSDEWCGHMMGYFFYYQLVADEKEKALVRRHVTTLVDHLIAHDYNMMDIDGTHTHWAVWSPASLNRDPEWAQDKTHNSMELLAFLKLAWYMTGDTTYQHHYLHLIKDEHYLDNMAGISRQDPAWFIYYDATMQAYLYPILLHCEKDPALLDFYRQHLDEFIKNRQNDHNPLIDFLYCFARDKKRDPSPSLDFLTDTPLDLIDWHIDHTRREDIQLTHTPVLDEWQVDKLPPASIRQVVRWDKNPWAASGGTPDMEREPVFWLLPYWMGRYLQLIAPEQ